jgi:hypothetical protein
MMGCADGLVIGADSRLTVAGAFWDLCYKIQIPDAPQRCAFTVTGTSEFGTKPAEGVADWGEYLRSAPRTLNIDETVRSFLEKSNTAVSSLSVADLAERCISTVKQYQASDPDALSQFAGRGLCTIVIAGHDPDLRSSRLRRFAIHISSPSLEPAMTDEKDYVIGLTSPLDPFVFGETRYLIDHVYRGVGRQYLPKQTIDLLLSGRPTSSVSVAEAMAVVTDIINATSRTTALIPASSGIGGPVDVVLLGKERKAQKLRWKVESTL